MNRLVVDDYRFQRGQNARKIDVWRGRNQHICVVAAESDRRRDNATVRVEHFCAERK